ncbi:MAG: hypothetical protein K2Y31_03300 [Burkholderiales bacterium]|nr:hypothetical protein [Burkholderiales bacterium]
MEVLLTATDGVKPRRIGWVSFQPDGSISVGLHDKTFVSPNFNAKNNVWNAYNRVAVEYLIRSDPSTLRPIRNPHLTFHPPIYFHLKANGSRALYEGIADLQIMLSQDGIVPWIRFVFKPVSELSLAGIPRRPDRVRFLSVATPDVNYSVGLGVDFVRLGLAVPPNGSVLDELIDWRGYRVRIHAALLKPQAATLAWIHHK